MVTSRVGYAIAAWSALFAVPHVYWGLGGRAGVVATLGSVPTDPMFILLGTWGVAVVCAIGVVYGLALARRWGRLFPHWLLLAGAVVVGLALLLHGAQDVVQFAFLLAGVTHVSNGPDLGIHIRTQLFLWGPWFLLGGALFALAALSLRRGASR